jgi:hypothetical protein
MAENEKRPPKGFSSEDIRRSFAEESKHKLRHRHIDRKRERDQQNLLEAFRSGDRQWFAEACDIVGAVTGSEKREKLEALFRKKHGYV